MGAPHVAAAREARLVSWIAPWIPRGSSVVDIGAGTGLVAEAVCAATDANATLLDVVDYNRSSLPLRLYDGHALPFEARAFDVALLVFVLHHSTNPQGTLQEAGRVADRLVILEDTYRSPLERAALIWTDWILNRGHDIARAWGQRRPEQWLEFFMGEPLTVIHWKEIPPRWLGRYRDPSRHLLFVADSG